MSQDGIALVERFPDAEQYIRLRTAAGLSRKAVEAARRGLANTLYGVQLLRGGEVVGMGRVVGDHGCFYLVLDVAVAPELQGRGLGKRWPRSMPGCARARHRRRMSRCSPTGTPGTCTPATASRRRAAP